VKRGDIVLTAPAGDYGKPRPAVVVQSDALVHVNSVILGLMTSTIVDAPIYRITLDPTEENGLRAISQIMVEKLVAVRRDKCSAAIGRLTRDQITALNHMLALVVGIAD
jgi:mRNA interferase MazF